jgi:hypothetical protein
MELYQNNIGNEGAFLNATIELLKYTSVLINFYRDPRSITDTSDDRLKQNHDAMSWFIQWENSVKSNEKIRNNEKCLISHQTRQDIISAILGFEELSTYKLIKSNASIIHNRVNSDVINKSLSFDWTNKLIPMPLQCFGIIILCSYYPLLTFSDISGKQAPAAPPVFDFLEAEACPRITEFMVWQ